MAFVLECCKTCVRYKYGKNRCGYCLGLGSEGTECNSYKKCPTPGKYHGVYEGQPIARCPFCGGTAVFTLKTNGHVQIECGNDDCWVRPRLCSDGGAYYAIKRWNTRH